MQEVNVQAKNWWIASLVYHTGSETKRNNGKKIKQTNEYNKTKKQSESEKAVQGTDIFIWNVHSHMWQ